MSLWLALQLDIYRNQDTYFTIKLKEKGCGVHKHLQPQRWQGGIGDLDRPHRMPQRWSARVHAQVGAHKIPAEGQMFLPETWDSGILTPYRQ